MFIGCCCFTFFCTFVLYFKVIYNYYLCKMCLYIIVYNIGFGYIINFILLVVIIKIYMLLFKLVCIKILNILIIILRDRRIKLCRLLLHIICSNLLSYIILLCYYFQLMYPFYVFIIGSTAILKLLSIICPITLAVKLPVNSKQGFVLISISQTFPFLSIKKSYPNI